jgi:hypothetical protein
MTRRPQRSPLLPHLVAVALCAVLPLTAQAQEGGEEVEVDVEVESHLALASIEMDAAETDLPKLVSLSVGIANESERPITALAFEVVVEGVSLPVYDNQLFMQRLAPGETTTVELYNFWSGETGRPNPSDGKLDVTVRLREAQWLTVTKEGATDVWEVGDAVPGLPLEVQSTLSLTAESEGDEER